MIKQYYFFSTLLDNYAQVGTNIDHEDHHHDLNLLFFSFEGYHDWIFIDKTPEFVLITQYFFGDDEDEDFVIKIDTKNYDYILQKWQRVLKLRPQYFILFRDDHGWIELEMKNELSPEDQQYLNQHKIKKLQG